MIAQLTGLVVRAEANSVILDVNGVGYRILVPVPVLSSLPATGEKLTLVTHLIVREDELTLYGFLSEPEHHLFKILIGVTGVGPKVGLALLSTLSADELARALSANDTREITRVPGVGPRLAARLCTELGDKMAALAFERSTERSEAGTRTQQEHAASEDVTEALIGLGYSRLDARRAAEKAFTDAPDRADTGAMISAALALLTRRKS